MRNPWPIASLLWGDSQHHPYHCRVEPSLKLTVRWLENPAFWWNLQGNIGIFMGNSLVSGRNNFSKQHPTVCYLNSNFITLKHVDVWRFQRSKNSMLASAATAEKTGYIRFIKWRFIMESPNIKINKWLFKLAICKGLENAKKYQVKTSSNLFWLLFVLSLAPSPSVPLLRCVSFLPFHPSLAHHHHLNSTCQHIPRGW